MPKTHDLILNRSTLDPIEANCVALAAAMATSNGKLVTFIQSNISDAQECDVSGQGT